MAELIAIEDLLRHPLPGRIVAEGSDGAIDHPAFRERARDWQAAFAARPETDWALHFEDATEFAAALLGAWHAGKRVVLPGDALPGTLERLRPGVGGFAGDIPAAFEPISAAHGSGAGIAITALDPTATRLVLQTSGSTGEPVAIDKTLRELSTEIRALESMFGDDATVTVHGTVSHQHIYGLLHRVLWPLAAGRPIGQRLFFHEDLLRVLARDHASWLVASPAHLKRLPEGFDRLRLHGRVKRVFSSGGALPADAAIEAMRLIGTGPLEIFGSSETGGIAWRQWTDAAMPAWTALPGVEWRIEDGLLVIQSPHLPPGTGAWTTADRAAPCGDGGFRLLGRADRIAKIEERRVSLDALERDLLTHPGVEEARVLVFEEGLRQWLAGVVVASAEGRGQLETDGPRAFSRKLARHLEDRHDPVVQPRRWRFVDALPVDAQGKTTRRALAALFRPEFPEAEWREREPRQAEIEFLLDPALAVFEGHFPQAPILPGVAQVDWAIRLGREAFDLPPRFLRLDALKFQRTAGPDTRIHLRLDWDPARGSLSFRYQSDLGIHASGRAVFGEAE